MDIGTAIVTGAVVGSGFATLGWIFGQRQNRALTRLEHTFSILNSYRSDTDHWEAYDHFVALVTSNNMPKFNDTTRAHDVGKIRRLLIHYEYIAVGVFCGGLDEHMVMECDKGNVVNLYKNTAEYIEEIRTTLGRNSIYKNLENLAKRWDRPPPAIHHRLAESLKMRPLRQPTPKLKKKGKATPQK